VAVQAHGVSEIIKRAFEFYVYAGNALPAGPALRFQLMGFFYWFIFLKNQDGEVGRLPVLF
jgi:hypothetical protein